MARAFVTALTHADEATRQQAAARVAQWDRVLAGMADGSLEIGSRTPVAGLPDWVTLEVVRGGFATGGARAGGPLEADEVELADRLGIGRSRAALFAHHLSSDGLTEVTVALDNHAYRVQVPEEAALLVVAWLVRAGDASSALDFLEVIRPFAGQLRFTPRLTDRPGPEPSMVWRRSAGDAQRDLLERRPNHRVAAMREAVLVWAPFADELLDLWLQRADDKGQIAGAASASWVADGRALLDRYRHLAATHTACTKHRRRKENLAILIAALEADLSDAGLTARGRGLLRCAVEAMVAKRGRPGSERLSRLREEQAAQAGRPTFHGLSQVVAARLAGIDGEVGLEDPELVLGPVAAEEETADCPAGAVIPEPVAAVVRRSLAGTPEHLLAEGVVPSLEVLAELVPKLAALTISQAYADEGLQRLMAATYEAFRRRRSLLLRNLTKQVQFEELPWVQAVRLHRSPTALSEADDRTALVRFGELAIQAFPGVLLPNPLIAEMAALARDGRMDVPFVEELAADIFEGRFSPKFLAAAKLAASQLEDSLYQRYYEINYPQILTIDGATGRSPFDDTPLTFDYLCHLRAEIPQGHWSVAGNGMVIEQAQILTTHNLALLVHLGVQPSAGWDRLAWQAVQRTFALIGQVEGADKPLPIIKNAAYAWRHAIFHLSQVDSDRQYDILAWAEAALDTLPPPTQRRARPVVLGLRRALDLRVLLRPDDDDHLARTFTGWAVGGHWMANR